MSHKLVITITIEDEETAKNKSLETLNNFQIFLTQEWYENTQVALVREGDRSAGNLLLEPLEGRFGHHLQGRKAKLSEVLQLKDNIQNVINKALNLPME